MTGPDNQDLGMKISIARQPIFDNEKNVYAYELLLRSYLTNDVTATDDETPNLKVIGNSLLIGLPKLAGDKRAFIRFNRQMLLDQFHSLFPMNSLGVEIREGLEPENKIIKVCKQMKKAGCLLILNDFVFEEKYKPLLQLADIIRIDSCAKTNEEIRFFVQQVDSKKVTLLAERIDSQAEYERALKLGFLYFQGSFFQKPDLVTKREIPGYKLNYLKILKKIHDPALEFDEIEQIIKRDVSLTHKLLRYINSAHNGPRVTVQSIRNALIRLGQKGTKRWLTIVVMSDIGREKPLELLNNSVIRARFCELIAEGFKLHPQPPNFFFLGMFSLVDAFLDRPMAEILEELPLEEDVKSALLGKRNLFREVLELVVAFENADWETCTQLAAKLKIDEEKVAHLYMESVEWGKLIEE